MSPGEARDTAACEQISALLSRVGDKWTVLVVGVLGAGPIRFNALRRHIGDISQKMLSTTLRNLERDGFVTRTVTPTTPPQVEYALTELGRGLLEPVRELAMWTVANAARIEAARRDYAAREAEAARRPCVRPAGVIYPGHVQALRQPGRAVQEGARRGDPRDGRAARAERRLLGRSAGVRTPGCGCRRSPGA